MFLGKSDGSSGDGMSLSASDSQLSLHEAWGKDLAKKMTLGFRVGKVDREGLEA